MADTVKNVNSNEKDKDNNRNKILMLLVGVILLLICGLLCFLMYYKTYVPEYYDIVDFNLDVATSDCRYNVMMYKIDYNRYSYRYIEYNADGKPTINLSGNVKNREMIEITDKFNLIDFSEVEDRLDTSGGSEYVILQSDRVTNGKASQGSNHSKKNIVCYDNIPEDLKTQLKDFNDFLKSYIDSGNKQMIEIEVTQ